MKYLVEELREKNDLFISNVIKQQHLHPKDRVEAAKIIFKERNLNSAKKLNQLAHIAEFKRYALREVQAGTDEKTIIHNLEVKGLDKEQSGILVSEAIGRTKRSKKRNSRNSETAIVVIIIFIVLRIIVRVIKN